MVKITGKICVFKRTIVVEMDAGIYIIENFVMVVYSRK